MKTKDLFSIVVKIIGIIALWNALQAFGTMITGVGIFTSMLFGKNHMGGAFMFTIAMAMFLNFLVPLAIAFVCFFRAERVRSLLNISEQYEVDIQPKKQEVFHMLLIVFGFIAVMHGAGNFLSFDHRTDTKVSHVTNSKALHPNMEHANRSAEDNETRSVTTSNTKKINHFALFEIIIGIIMLSRATEYSKKIVSNYEMKSSSSSSEGSNQ